jgi:hypothetical protein
MAAVCQRQFGSGYVDSHTDDQDPRSWICTGPSGDVRGNLMIQEYACDIDFPGSNARRVPDNQIPAYWWKCVS